MNRSYVVEFSDEAWFAIDAHTRHVAGTLRSPLNAGRWLRRLLNATDGLAEMPTRFAIDERESARGEGTVYRLTFERSCVLLYEVDDPARVVRILSFHFGGRP